MINTTTITPLNGSTISIHLTNLSAPDAAFLTEVIRVFTDPAKRGLAQDLRAGALCLTYDCRGDGAVLAYRQCTSTSCFHRN